MKNPERIIFVPLGDKANPDLERSGSYEAWKLSRDLLGEEKDVMVSTESLQKHPKVNLIYNLKKGITSLGGYLVKIQEIKIPRRT